jgi:antibiotic biosynthesis monooxygenase (ABM) superfamily enzyme
MARLPGWSTGAVWSLIRRGLNGRFGVDTLSDFLEQTNSTDEDPPVTAVASRRVKAGKEQEFEEWVSGILGAAEEFSGYLGSNVIRPRDDDDDEFQIVFKFDHASNLKRWEESEERHAWLRQVQPLVHEENVRVLTGLETWFTLPSRPGEPAPPRYKMAVVTWIAVFPLATAIFAVTQPLLGGLPTVLRTLVFTLIMVTTMTYGVMPRMTRLFSFWLYPDD